jgi:hypothetical protein
MIVLFLNCVWPLSCLQNLSAQKSLIYSKHDPKNQRNLIARNILFMVLLFVLLYQVDLDLYKFNLDLQKSFDIWPWPLYLTLTLIWAKALWEQIVIYWD